MGVPISNNMLLCYKLYKNVLNFNCNTLYKSLINKPCGGSSNSELCDLAEKYGALTFIDECHATGFLGETGRYLDTLELKLCTQILDLNFINRLYGKNITCQVDF